MTATVKICPACSAENGPTLFFCDSCGCDIATIVPSSKRPSPPGRPAVQETAPENKAKLCPRCKQENPAFAILCLNCGYDLTSSTPETPPGKVPRQAERPEPDRVPAEGKSRLELVVGQTVYACRSGDFLGREGTVACEVFAGLQTVSRHHVSFNEKDGHWFITVPEGIKNITQLDGRELPRGVPQPLGGEHILRMSTKCEVRLRLAPA